MQTCKDKRTGPTAEDAQRLNEFTSKKNGSFEYA